MVEVDTTYATPASVDELVVEASVAGSAAMTAVASLAGGERPPPRTVVLVHRGGPLGPVAIDATARLRGAPIVSAGRDLAFEPGRTLRVRIVLEPSCASVVCPSGQTCESGSCRPRVVPACELARSCADAGPRDAGPRDAPPPLDAPVPADTPAPRDTPAPLDAPDGGPSCVLDLGLCAPAVAMLGDTVALRPCGADVAGVTVSYSTIPPTGAARTEPTFVADRVGTFAASAVASAPAGCTAMTTIRVDAFALVPPVGRPGGNRRDLAARVGMAFLATDSGPWAVTRAGWRDLQVGAVGTLVNRNLAAVVVRGAEPFFGANSDESFLVRVRTADDFSTIELLSTPIPATGDRTVRAMSVPPDPAENGGLGPMVVGTKDGLLLLDGTPDTLAARVIGVVFDAEVDVAIGASEPTDRGAVWAVDNNQEIRNLSRASGAPFAAGAPVALTPTMVPTAVALDDRGPSPRLVLCAQDTGIQIFDLAIDWSARTTLPAPLASLSSISCLDVAIGGEGDYWVATATSLLRVGPDGSIRYRSMAGDGLGAASLVNVATAWNGTTREVWVMTALGDVYVAASDAP